MQTKNKNKFVDNLLKGNTQKFAAPKAKSKSSDSIIITPEKARHVLKFYNKTNRPPSAVHVTKLATDMMNGDWVEAGQTISFDWNGNLLDGQHRLLAIIQTGIQQELDAVFGLDPEVFSAIDNGKVRTSSEIAVREGYGENSAILTSLAKAIIVYEHNGQFNPKKGFDGVNQITKAQILNHLKNNMDLNDYADRYKRSQVVSGFIGSFCYWLLSTVDQAKAEEYLDQVFLGFNLQPDTIESYLFNKFQRNRNAVQNKMTKTAIISNTILGWRRFMGYSKSQAMQINWDARKGIPKPN